MSRTTVTGTAAQTASEADIGLLQRKCNCGNKASVLSDECEECQTNSALGLQARLTIGASDDPLEREADRAAAQVLAMKSADIGAAAVTAPVLTARSVSSQASSQDTVPDSADIVLRRPGRPLDDATREFMERHFGQDLGDVRLHTDSAAAQSAKSLSARAYTYGQHIVFGPGGYSVHASESRQRLAHELTHVIQQRQPGGLNLSSAQREAEARQASTAISRGSALPRISAASPAISRDPEPASEDDASFAATLAEATCDIGALCRLSHSAPTVVTHERLMSAYSLCHPGISPVSLIAGNPCLTPNFGLPALPTASASPTAPGPRRRPGPLAAPASTPAPASGGGLSLPSTTIRFNIGAAAVTVDLPASLAIRLPVPFRGAERVVFTLNASTDAFSFRATINATQHVRIIANAAITTAGVGSAGLTVQTTRTTCQAVSPAAARSALQSAGTRLRDAIQAVQTPPAADPDASELSRTFAPHARYAEVVAAVVHLNSEIERIQAPCREVPVASFNFGVQGQLTTPDDPEDRGAPTFAGASVGLHF